MRSVCTRPSTSSNTDTSDPCASYSKEPHSISVWLEACNEEGGLTIGKYVEGVDPERQVVGWGRKYPASIPRPNAAKIITSTPNTRTTTMRQPLRLERPRTCSNSYRSPRGMISDLVSTEADHYNRTNKRYFPGLCIDTYHPTLLRTYIPFMVCVCI